MDENRSKRKLDLKWDELLPERSDEPPVELIVKKHKSTVPAPKSESMSGSGDDLAGGEAFEQKLSDKELRDMITRMTRNFGNLSRNLPDKGDKMRSTIQRLEKELERRTIVRVEIVDRCDRPAQAVNSGASDGFRQDTTSFQVKSQPSFVSHFSEKLEKNMDFRAKNAYGKELSILSHRKMRSNKELLKRERPKERTSSREWPFQSASSPSHRKDKSDFFKGDPKVKASSPYHSQHIRENYSSSFLKNRKDAFEVLPSNCSSCRKGRQAVVLLDEDEAGSPSEESNKEPLLVEITEQADELVECMMDIRIYYPSRDDPECVEICYGDINNLAPTAYLTSPIMNFYIRFLKQQASPTNSAIQDCHFFNTYFYKKLTEAVSYQGGDKDSFFLKFRRWWKGVNIFKKAYVLIPIHEDLHWSLVIICIPDKEDESGPIILHLDSLQLHSSRSVFTNIRRYLKEEWNYLNQQVSPDLPIADRIWKNLPRRIEQKIIEVPQQKNEYDCGLFVLYFMERFIKDAPERLKKKDLEMFGKKWFRPEEASNLRVKIRNLLKLEFKHASKKSFSNTKSTSHQVIPEPESDVDIVLVS